MKRTIVEKIIVVLTWTGLVGGILFSLLCGHSVLASADDMSVPQALVYILGGTFLSVGGWAVLMQLVALSDRIGRLEEAEKE